jgi:hypothetical protein
MRRFNKDEFLNAISMLPGIGLIVWWLNYLPYYIWPPLLGYILMCSGSILYHSVAMVNEERDPRLLRVDLVCQNIACITGVLYSPYSDNSILITTIILCTYISCVMANLRDPREVALAKLSNAVNLFIMVSFDKVLIIEFIGSGCIFLYYYVVRINDYSHAIWHLTIHIVIHRYIKLLLEWQMKHIFILDIAFVNDKYIKMDDYN